MDFTRSLLLSSVAEKDRIRLCSDICTGKYQFRVVFEVDLFRVALVRFILSWTVFANFGISDPGCH